jgi:hypothetical protein
MKKILFIFMLLGMVQSIMAQPAARRKQAQQKAQQSNADNMTLRAKLYFPTAIPMDEDVVWRRDIYRELNLTDDANAALYYPVEPPEETLLPPDLRFLTVEVLAGLDAEPLLLLRLFFRVLASIFFSALAILSRESFRA